MMWCLDWRVRPCKLVAATTSAAHDTHACVLQAFGTTGMVGICTPKLGWALEVTRDGKGSTEHSACFKANGRYAPLMHAKVIKLHSIVDLRSPSASPGHQAAPWVAHPHLYTVLFSEDFKQATIHHDQDSVKEAEVAGDAGQEVRDFLIAHSVAASPSLTFMHSIQWGGCASLR